MTNGRTSREGSGRRLLMLLGWSLALHLLVWLGVDLLPDPPPVPEPPRTVDIRIVEPPPPPNPLPAPPPAPEPPPPEPRKKRPTQQTQDRQLATAPRPAPDAPPLPQTERPTSIDPGRETDASAPDQGGSTVTEGGEEAGLAARAHGVRLFDSGALGKVIAPKGRPADLAPELLAEAQKREGAAAEEARVGARLEGWMDAAVREGQVRGGLISECADGLDQGLDDEIDCAAPGCRLLPFCANTQIIEASVRRAIPDDDVGGVESTIEVPGGGRVRALSIKLRFRHQQPGDLAVVLESPTGKRVVVRRADRHESRYPRAFYIRGLEGEEVAGTWKLKVVDAIAGATGTLEGWQIVITG